MSSKAGIRELAMALVRKHDITQKDAERFVTLMFDTLNEGLETDKLVKLKGLGTFKVTNVSARKSIDVNTGEPIVIESRDKISFTPDNTMRDLVNRPFSQFETVVVNEGVDLEMLENVSTTPNSEEEPNELSEPEMPSTHEETEPILIAEDVSTTIETPVEEPTEQPQGPSTVQESTPYRLPGEPAPAPTETPPSAVSKEETPAEPAVPSSFRLSTRQLSMLNADENPEQKEETTVMEEPNAPTTKEETAEVDLADEEETTTTDNSFVDELIDEIDGYRRQRSGLVAALVVLLLCGGGLFWYVSGEMEQRDHRIAHLETLLKSVPTIKKKSATIPLDSTVSASTADVPPLVEETLPPDATQKEVSQTQPKKPSAPSSTPVSTEKVAQQKPEASSAAPIGKASVTLYNSDARVRTGAYRIVGVAQTVTMRKGQTLQSISRSLLGPGMECYVEALNGKNADLKEGQTLKIPQLELKRRKR